MRFLRPVVVSCTLALGACATTEPVRGHFVVATSPDQYQRCEYVTTFKMNFHGDGVPVSQASAHDQRESANGLRTAVLGGANLLYRVDRQPAALVAVNAYRCPIRELTAVRTASASTGPGVDPMR